MLPIRSAVALASLLAACSTTVSTTEALIATTPPPTTTATPEPSTLTVAAEPLVAAGCASFDSVALTELAPIDNELRLVEDRSQADSLVCNFVGVGDGIDTGIRIEVELVADQPEGHYVVAGQVESEVEIAGVDGVGSGRGNVRLQLNDERGVTLAVTIRALSSSATIPRDGAFLVIRDAVAAYVVKALSQP